MKKQNVRSALALGALAALSMMLPQYAFSAHATRHTDAVPFSYPNSLLDAPATLTKPLGAGTRLGKPIVVLEHTPIEAVTDLTGAVRVRDGRGDFARDILCVTGTEHGKPMISWLISSDNKTITETQIEWLGDRTVPAVCKPLKGEHLPVRIGSVGLGQQKDDILKRLGKPSLYDEDGWYFWFSQRFLRNERNLQELELNWLAVHFDANGESAKSFSAQVTNL